MASCEHLNTDAWRQLQKKAEEAHRAGELEDSSWTNLREWLTGEDYCWAHAELRGLLEAGQWRELNDRFYRHIPFGTGGRRGTVGAGTNRINHRTIAESAQGVANYLRTLHPEGHPLSVAIAYDTRHYSTEFSRIAASVFAASGFTVCLFREARPTPELSFAVRNLKADVGIVISASHNPPPDNGFKVYWSDGGQLVPPHDARILEQVEHVEEVAEADLDEALRQGLIRWVGEEMDERYIAAVFRESLLSEQNAASLTLPKTLYSPLHGTGLYSVPPVLRRLGLRPDRELFILEEQATPDGDFPNVPNHIANPEEPSVMELGIQRAKEIGAELVMATDPDADRLGVAVPVAAGSAEWKALTGNQICALLTHFVVSQLSERKALPQNPLVVKTLVTSELVTRVAEAFGVGVRDNLLVGFKYIGEVIHELEEQGQEARFVFGAEESHGYLKGTYARDKDACVSALLMAELAARAHARGRTPYQALLDLYREHGYFHESVHSQTLRGMEGQAQIAELMRQLREEPPAEVAGLRVTQIRDCLTRTRLDLRTGERSPWDVPQGDLLFFYLGEDGYTRFAARPSGTEPKIKFYITAYAEVPAGASDEELRRVMSAADARGRSIADALMERAQAVKAGA